MVSFYSTSTFAMRKNSTILFVLLPVLVLLSACAPKYQYVSPEMPAQGFKRIYVVMDYVEFVDDVGALFDYDLTLNHERLAGLEQTLSGVLKQKGYEAVYFISKSSGVGLNSGVDFELYEGKKYQEKLVSPPFLIEAQHITVEEQDQLLTVFNQFQTQAMVPVKEENMKYLNRIQMAPVSFSDQAMDSDIPAAVLFVQVIKPRVSFAKGFGMALASTALSVGASGGAFYTTVVPHGVSYSNTLLFDMLSGELLWKNHHQSSIEMMGSQSLKQYFESFPVSD